MILSISLYTFENVEFACYGSSLSIYACNTAICRTIRNSIYTLVQHFFKFFLTSAFIVCTHSQFNLKLTTFFYGLLCRRD